MLPSAQMKKCAHFGATGLTRPGIPSVMIYVH